MATKKDYYESLGVDKNASKTDIKKAYRKLAKQYHPDRNKDAGADVKFKEMQEAYEILSDDQKKAAYDQYGFAGADAFGGGHQYGGSDLGDLFGNGGGLGDLFGDFFGGGFNDGGGRGRRQSVGSDIQTTINLEFSEAVFGVEKEIIYERNDKCDSCSGTGAKDGKMKTCATCGGRGQVAQMQRTILGSMQIVQTCSTCSGTGQIPENTCPVCNARGVKKIKENLKIKIPAGIPDGVNLRFSNKGNAAERGGAHGDLYVQINVKDHPVLERRGNDVYMDKHISVTDAVLGGEVEVPTVHGSVIMKVPEGTQSEKVLRLKEKGGPKFRQNGNGDQYVRLIVDVPTKLSGEQKRLWEELKGVSR